MGWSDERGLAVQRRPGTGFSLLIPQKLFIEYIFRFPKKQDVILNLLELHLTSWIVGALVPSPAGLLFLSLSQSY